MPEKRKVLITGSCGMLGIDLFNKLSGDYEVCGIDVIVGCRLSVAGKNFICDITDKAAVSRVISKIRPEIVIHAAAWTDVDGCELNKEKAYKVNFTGTKNVADGCKSSGAVLIYISTDFVFDGEKKRPYKETDKIGPLNAYAESKLEGENYIRKNLKNYFILRTSWLYGRNGKNFVDTIINKAGREKELKVVDDQVGSPTHTVDLAEAICVLLNGLRGVGVYHVSNAGAVSWYEYAKTILRLMGSKTKVLPISSEELDRPAKRPPMSALDNSKFTALTGHKMRGWEEALKEYLSC